MCVCVCVCVQREAAGVPEAVKGRKEKREVLSKRAKRRMADRTSKRQYDTQ